MNSESVEDIVANLTNSAIYKIKRREGKIHSWQSKKKISDKKQKDWFKNHKTKLKQTRGWKKLDKIEKRGIAPIGTKERYAELDALPKEMVIAACKRDLELFAEYYFRHYLNFPSSKLHYWLYHLFTRETHKTIRGTKWAVAAPRGNAKCLKYDTKIQLGNGELKNISDVEVGDTVVSFNPNFKLVNDVIISKEYSGKKEVRDIIFTSGRTISATADHRLFNIHGEIKVDDIEVGSKLATPRKLDCVCSGNTMKIAESVFLANIIAEGCLAGGPDELGIGFKCSYTNFDEEVVEDFRSACKELGFGFSKGKNGKYYNIQRARPYLRKQKLGGCLSTNKLIPEEVFLQDNFFLSVFISRFIATDGADRNPFLYNLATSDIFWDEVKSISEPYVTDTYDIETKKYHNFVANNIFSHNSSLTTLFFPVWCILYKKKNFIIIISDTAGQAEDFLREIKNELLGNEHILKHFPECCKKTELWRNDEIITSNDVRVTSLGSQSKILGRRHKADRPDLLILDDIEGQDDVLSQLVRERKEDWFTKEVLKCGRVDGKTDFYVVGTIKHQDSLLNKLLSSDKYQNWGKKIFKSVIDFASNEELWSEWSQIYTDKDLGNTRFDAAREFYDEHEKEMLEGTKVLWPAGEPYYQLMEVMQEGTISFYCIAEGTTILDKNFHKKKVEDVRIGDEVVQSSGKSGVVEYINTRKVNDELVKLYVSGYTEPLIVTPEHPFLIRESNKYKLKWKLAGDIIPLDSVVQPLPKSISNDKLYSKVRKVEKVIPKAPTTVYGFSVSGDKTYCLPGAVVHNSEKQNVPIDRTKCLIEPTELHMYTAADIEDRDLVYYGAYDPAIGKKKTSDFPAVVSIAKCRKSGKVFIVDAWARKNKTEAQIKEIFRKHGKYNYYKFGIETTAFQVVLKDYMEKISRITQIYLPIVEIKHTAKESKEARIEWIYPFLRDGTVSFHETQKELIEQVCNFTPDGKTLMHDDLVDALSMVLRLSLKKNFKFLCW